MVEQLVNEYQPDYTVFPGEVLAYELEFRGMRQQELAKRTGLTPKHIVSLVKGKSAITSETAIKLERALGMPAEYWLNLESQFQETQARLAEGEQLETDLDWLKKIPVNAMIKLGWISRYKDKKEQLVEVLRFLGIASVDQWDDVWPKLNVAYRQHSAHEVFPEAVSAWLRQGDIQASAIQCNIYDKNAFRKVLDEIRGLTTEPPEVFVPEMQKLCASAGVAVVYVPGLPKTCISGATRWINSKKAIIQLSLRYKTDDHLWFTFFHEAGHILLHGKKEMFLEGANGLDVEKEEEANKFSEHELIPKKSFSKFILIGRFSKASIVEFAQAVGIAPGIVVGQLQHKNLLKRSFCNELKQRFVWI
ncbi:MAG: HigA family addiction module antidote protein [Gammaproteobacteria bacterium]|jgi:addiction module HigA family antidote|nr:HigA family addiction module antidote protein [Gammaproteobacteria bacterium]MBT4196860.1 HigA family addiction module antidote protein [Gammaproteobacteria bacterium]MBT4450005.1 HigA family addiction module antidote protein [Gammaproteobacteria bacterium]MBT4861888.1 HigA family addiction module antidote protein [Gammaproteobacteria bacterium]MBT6551734.1 HigA family addiction module antidote protein [Gammaproteobacteria bacterium]